MDILVVRTTPALEGAMGRGVFVQWCVKHAPTGAVLSFTLERAGSPEGPFEVVATDLSDMVYFDAHVAGTAEEPTAAFSSLAHQRYYRVREAGGDVSPAVPIGDRLVRRQMLLRRKMQRDFGIALRVGSGVPFFVLLRRHWGARCTTCFDPLTKSVLDPKCPVCFGTGFVDGYHTPCRTLGRKGVTNVVQSVSPQGKTEVNQVQLTLLDYPMVQVDDVFIEERTDRRYVVRHATPTELRGVPVHQRVILSELARDSVEYLVPLPAAEIPVYCY